MAETPSSDNQQQQLSPTRIPPESGSGQQQQQQYWCYHCDKRVTVETLSLDLPDLICFECKNGFVESIANADPNTASDFVDPTLGTQFLQVLRLLAQATGDHHDHDPDPTNPPPPPSDDDIELNGWDDDDDNHDGDDVEDDDDDDDDDDDGDDDDDDDDEHSVEVVHEEEHAVDDNNNNNNNDYNRSDDDDVEEEELRRRAHRDVLRLRLRDFASRDATRRNRILDWAEILMGLEDRSIEFRLQVPDDDGADAYVGNPGDYVDAAGYEALLQNLAESDSTGRRGAPPASKAAVEALEHVVIGREEDVVVCAVCKDSVSLGEVARNLPCGHGYHGECIVPWLGSSNTCPVCRFELPTDDPEYEAEKEKRVVMTGMRSSLSSSSGAAGGDGES